MAINIQIGTKSLNPSSFNLTIRTNGLDSATLAVAGSSETWGVGFLENNLITVLEDDKKLFSGYVINKNYQPKDGNISIQLNVESKLRLLKQNKTGIIQIQNQDIITILNNANLGITFKDYNLATSQAVITYQSISYKTSNQTWWDFLLEFANKLGFYFWYDYQDDVCYLGEPDQEIKQNNDDFLKVGASSFGGITQDKTDLTNKIIALGGGVTKTTMQYVSSDVTTSGGYVVKNDGDGIYYIQDDTSILKYGTFENQFNSPDVIQINADQSSLIAASSLIYSEAVTELKRRKDPKTTISDFKYYLSSNQLKQLSQRNYITANFHVNPNDLNSDLITGKFYLTDITHEYILNNSEGYYQCTLIDKVVNPIQQRLLKKYQIALNTAQPTTINPLNSSSFTLSVTSGGMVTTPNQNFSFAYDSRAKKINHIYLSLQGAITSGSVTFLSNLTYDGIDLSTIFNIAIGIGGTSNFPSSGKFDLLSIPNLTPEQFYILTNTTTSHILGINGTSFTDNMTVPSTADLKFTIEIQAEI